MSRRTLCHLKIFELLRQLRQRFGDGLRGRGALVAEKIAVAQPDNLAAAEEGEGLQRFAKFGDVLQRVTAVGDRGLDDFVVHAAKFVAPLLVNFPGAFLDGEFIVAADERKRGDFGWRAFYSVSLPLSLILLSTSLMSSTCANSGAET